MGKLIAWIFLGVALLLLGIGGAILFNSVNFLKTAIHTEGTVKDLQLHTGYSSGHTTRSYHALVEFTSKDGQKVMFRDGVGYNPSPYRVGDTVKVIYDPASPDKASIEGFASLWLVPMILGLVGLLFLVLAIAFFGAGRRTQP